MIRRRLFCFCAFVVGIGVFGQSHSIAGPPVVLDQQWRLEQVDQEPTLVTPTGCCFDEQGRLFVIECNTHFAPEGYDRADHDRIYLYQDRTGDGNLNQRTVFYDDGVATMNVAYLGEGWLAVATRSDVKRMRDTDGDDVADEIEVLLELKTEANYPHNGLGGLAFGADKWLYVGQGENFGSDYQLIASDGSQQVGSGEGGNIFRIRADGTDLQRFATGFWNPFGICLDSAGRVWTVGNDPDAMPPCRLLHVVEGADFGFQFRFGRAGIHPLQAWNGELPGTLPMASGTGEATCAVVQYGDALWVTSWGDNRIERYSLSPSGATMRAEMEIVVQGDANFRPVGLAVAEDGSIYFTDWVDRSYPVHGKGRLWRLIPKQNSEVAVRTETQLLSHTEQEMRAESFRAGKDVPLAELLETLGSKDSFLMQAGYVGLINGGYLQDLKWEGLTNANQRLGYLLAWRWQELIRPESLSQERRREILNTALQDDDESVLITAVRWATERGSKVHLDAIRKITERDRISPRLFDAVIAAIAYLETGSAAGGRNDPAIEALLIQFAKNAEHPAALRALAVRKLPAGVDDLTMRDVRDFLTGQSDRLLGLEVVRYLATIGEDDAEKMLAEIALDETLDLETRADAVASLAGNASEHARVINKLSLPRQPEVLRTEARRIIDYSASRQSGDKPAADDLAAWEGLVGTGGSVDAGRRVFWRRSCANCHAHAGRGANTGPDLTTFAATTTTGRLLESILLPNKEIGPLYVPYRILTVDGQVLTGLKLDGSGAGAAMRFQGADGQQFSVAMTDVDVLEPVQQSIMPSGLHETMTIDEFRDLVAFLRAEAIGEQSKVVEE